MEHICISDRLRAAKTNGEERTRFYRGKYDVGNIFGGLKRHLQGLQHLFQWWWFLTTDQELIIISAEGLIRPRRRRYSDDTTYKRTGARLAVAARASAI
jgi:hypothetical protein